MTVLASTTEEAPPVETTTDGPPSFMDNAFLDEFQLHFGEWMKQIVDWSDQNLQTPIKVVEWPFRTLFDLLMSDDPNRTAIMDIPWYWVAIAFFIIGSVARNTKVGLSAGIMVATCGLLGPDYWSETTKTFGMVFISVLLCAVIGIPLGILCGRIQAVWNVTRPVLDAMQVVHSFVYMLPFIFFWKVGEVSATMVTMMFALPPLVRLTNLGIRQVPEDVVEAARSYGSTERRVLTDVQLPLARPAIMTGLNQTLLLAISMLGIAALMGAGGLGKLLLRAINSQNLPLAASGGLAFFLVAVVLDRISQREHDDGMNLFARIREALVYRADPEGLMIAQAERSAATEAAAIIEAAAAAELEAQAGAESPAPVSPRERLGLLLAVVGGLVAAASAFLPWGVDAGLVSSWGRRNDEIGLIGQSFLGIEASGGSIFAVIVILFGLLAAAAALRPLFGKMPGLSRNLNRLQGVLFAIIAAGAVLVWLLNILDVGFGPLSNIGLILFAIAFAAIGFDTWARHAPRLGADGAFIAAFAAFGAAVGYLLLQPSGFVEQYSHGIGAYLAVAATAVALVGAGIAAGVAPYAPRRPLKLSANVPMLVGVVVAGLIIGVGTYSAWIIDERLDSLITPEMQAEIDRLQAEAADDINKQIANGQEITNMINLAQAQDAPVTSALDSDGPRLGWPVLGFGLIAMVGALFAAGIMPANERARWLGGAVAAGSGLAAVAIAAGWILSFTRSGEPKAITGAGSLIALAGAFVLFAIGRSAVGEFQRRKIYADSPTLSDSVESDEFASEIAADPGLVGS